MSGRIILILPNLKRKAGTRRMLFWAERDTWNYTFLVHIRNNNSSAKIPHFPAKMFCFFEFYVIDLRSCISLSEILVYYQDINISMILFMGNARTKLMIIIITILQKDVALPWPRFGVKINSALSQIEAPEPEIKIDCVSRCTCSSIRVQVEMHVRFE